jgi:hypothetical protein
MPAHVPHTDKATTPAFAPTRRQGSKSWSFRLHPCPQSVDRAEILDAIYRSSQSGKEVSVI